MRNFLAFLLAMTLVLFGKMILNPMPTGAAVPSDLGITKTEKLAFLDSNQNNAVEKDGVRFEILVRERTWVIPANQPDASTPLRLGIRMTNKTQKPIRFPQFDPVMVLGIDIIGEDGFTLKPKGARERLLVSPEQRVCRLAKPEQSLTYDVNAKLYWQNNRLVFGIPEGWYYEGLKPGNYRIRFKYSITSITLPSCENLQTLDQAALAKISEEFWSGLAVTPFVDIRVVEP
jgi:hypothetical protein